MGAPPTITTSQPAPTTATETLPRPDQAPAPHATPKTTKKDGFVHSSPAHAHGRLKAMAKEKATTSTTAPKKPEVSCDTSTYKTVSLNDTGDYPSAANQMLDCLGYKTGTTKENVTIFTEGSKAALMNFQRDNGLKADGVIGPKTWAAMMNPGAYFKNRAPGFCRKEEVNLANMKPIMQEALPHVKDVWKEMAPGIEPVITSGNDSLDQHKAGSAHGHDQALDFRANNVPPEKMKAMGNALQKRLDQWVLTENKRRQSLKMPLLNGSFRVINEAAMIKRKMSEADKKALLARNHIHVEWKPREKLDPNKMVASRDAAVKNLS